MTRKKINIIGSGNVATHLATALSKKNSIINIFSAHIENAKTLADKVNAQPINKINELNNNVDLNIICLKDDVIKDISILLPKYIPVVHTSGSVGIEVFEGFDNYGTLYPLQTFSKNKPLNITDIPFLIEANSNSFTHSLIQFCKDNFSDKVYQYNSEQRKQIHLAAVIANNFLTALLVESESILTDNDIDFEILKPLLLETIQKSFETSPMLAQTGPAKRNDQNIIKTHLSMIENDDLKQIYKLMSQLIIKQQQSIL